jgi:hypothetical protein
MVELDLAATRFDMLIVQLNFVMLSSTFVLKLEAHSAPLPANELESARAGTDDCGKDAAEVDTAETAPALPPASLFFHWSVVALFACRLHPRIRTPLALPRPTHDIC